MQNRKVVLKTRPENRAPEVTDFEVIEETLPELQDGQVLLQAEHLSIDAFIRTTLDGDPGHHGTMDLNTPVVALGVGRVVLERPVDRMLGRQGCPLARARKAALHQLSPAGLASSAGRVALLDGC